MLSDYSWLARVLFSVAIFGTVTSAVSFLLALAGGIKFRANTKKQATYFPPISVLKPVHGAEQEQEQNLRSFFEIDYPDFELIFCARSIKDPAILCAKELAKKYPLVPVSFIESGDPIWTNPKVFSMSLLAKEAKHETVLFSDSDIRVGPDYLREVIQPLADPKVGMVTCVFRGKPGNNLPSLLIALNQTVEFSSGVITANLLEAIKFALGPTLLTRKAVLDHIGGFEPMQDVYADDYCLANRIASHGYTVVLSDFVVDHFIYYKNLAAGLRHQIGWMKSTRRSRPAGHFGVGLTYAMPFGVLALLAGLTTGHLVLGAWLFFAACANRWLQALLIGFGVMQSRPTLKFFWIYPLCDLLGFYCWFVSYFGSVIEYRGRKYRLMRDGRVILVANS